MSLRSFASTFDYHTPHPPLPRLLFEFRFFCCFVFFNFPVPANIPFYIIGLNIFVMSWKTSVYQFRTSAMGDIKRAPTGETRTALMSHQHHFICQRRRCEEVYHRPARRRRSATRQLAAFMATRARGWILSPLQDRAFEMAANNCKGWICHRES